MTEKDDLWKEERESDEHLMRRAIESLIFIFERKEKTISIISHSSFTWLIKLIYFNLFFNFFFIKIYFMFKKSSLFSVLNFLENNPQLNDFNGIEKTIIMERNKVWLKNCDVVSVIVAPRFTKNNW